MKRLFVSLAALLLTFLAFAQTPNSFNYQAVVRGSDGEVLQNTNVSFRFSVLESSPTGTAVYVETQSATTNQYGLVNLTIGEGTVVSGDMSAINWGGASHYLKVDMDASGGSAYTDMTNQQLVAVPYALHAGTVENSDNDNTNEMQELTKVGYNVTLSKGGGTISIADGDSLSDNELQDLQLSSDQLSLTNSTSTVPLSDLNYWTLSGNSLMTEHDLVSIGTLFPSSSFKMYLRSEGTRLSGFRSYNDVDDNGTSYTINSYTTRDAASTGIAYGIHNTMIYSPNSGGGATYGIHNSVSSFPNDASGQITYGIYNDVNRGDSGSGLTYGSYLDVDHSGNDGTVYGNYIDVDITGGSPDLAYGTRNSITKNGDGSLYGHYNFTTRGSAYTGNTYGLYNYLSTSPTSTTGAYNTYAVYNRLLSNPANDIDNVGYYLSLSRGGTGGGETHGDHYLITHNGSGILYGSHKEITRTDENTSRTYGDAIYVETLGGTTYGLYSDVTEGTSTSSSSGFTYGGYFNSARYGNMNGYVFGARAAGFNYTTATGARYAYGLFAYAFHNNANGTAYTYSVYGNFGGSGDVEYAGYFAGNVYTTGSYLPSDQVLKNSIVEAGSSLDRILQLNVYDYEYNTADFMHMNLPEGAQTGFLAQDMQRVFPELTTAAHQPPLEEEEITRLEESGKTVSPQARQGLDFTAVNYAGLVPHLTKAIQEQQAIIESQQQELEALRARLAAIEALLGSQPVNQD